MNAQIRPISALNQRAINALVRDVGIVDTIRFLNQFKSGFGDYTVERKQLFRDVSVNDIVNAIKAQRPRA